MNRWLKLGTLVAIGGLVTLALSQGWLSFLADENRVAHYLDDHGVSGVLIVTFVGCLYTALGGPRQLLAFVMGYALGAVNGTLLSTLATVLGASLCFFTARLMLRQTLTHHFGARMRRFDQLFEQRTALKILMVRLLPVGSNLVTNLLSGCSGIRPFPFLAGSGLGYLPQMLVFALAGAGIGNADHYQFGLSLALFVIASLLGAYLYQQHRARDLTKPISSES